jgi:hypothetical protein
MPMTAYARLMQMRADIEKIKALSASRHIAQDDEKDLLPEEQSASAGADEQALLPGERKPERAPGLRRALN